jgi:putative membrane protein
MLNGWGYSGMGAGAWTIMVFAMLVFWALVAFGIVAFFRRSSSTPSSDESSHDTPEKLLRARFARGEIEEAEFRTRMAALKEHR